MGRNKTNPDRIPVSVSSAEIKRILDEETDHMLLCSWAVVLCALAGRRDTTAESLLAFCEAINSKSANFRFCGSVTSCLMLLEDLTGDTFPLYPLSTNGIRSKGDVMRLRRKAGITTMHTMFALIADTAVTHQLMNKNVLQTVFQKVHAIDESLHAGEITLQDLLWVLEEEYALCLTMQGTRVVLQCKG